MRNTCRERDLAPLASELGLQLEGSRRRRAIAMGVALAALVMLVTAVTLVHAITRSVPEPKTSWVDDESSRTIVSLTVQEDLPYTAIQESIDELRARLDRYFGEGDCQMVADGDKVTLLLPDDAFGSEEWEDVLYTYFVYPIELYAYNSDGTVNDGYVIERDAVHIDRSQIVSAITSEGGSVVIQFDEQTYATLSDMDKEEGDLHLDLDVAVKSSAVHGFFDIEFNDDEHSIRLPPDADSDSSVNARLSDVLAFALSRDAMPGSFEVSIEPHVDWHAFDGQVFGTNRVSPEEVGGDAGIVIVTRDDSLEYRESFLQEDLEDIREVLCTRLDAMGVPYAFGKLEEGGRDTVLLVPIEYAGWPTAFLLGEDRGYARIHVGLESYDVKSTRLHEGLAGTSLSCEVNNGQQDALREALAKAKDAPVYLTVGGYPLLTAKADGLAKSTTLSFVETCFDSTDDDRWLFALIDAFLNGPQMPESIHTDVEVAPRNNIANGHVLSLGVTYESELADLLACVKEVVPDATVSADTTSVAVHLHLNVDETLQEQCLVKVKQIYQRIDFEHSVFDTVSFWPCELRAGERASIHFAKEQGASAIRAEPYVYLFGSFRGGRLERYKEDFSKRFLADEFYQSFDDGDFSFFMFE